MKAVSAFLFFAAVLTPALVCAQGAKRIPAMQEWPAYGHDEGGARYSPLTQVNATTVARLKVAWTFRTGELELYQGNRSGEKAAFEATPVMAAGKLFFSTPSDRVFCIDAASGRQVWMYDPKVNLKRDFSEITSRGVTMWPAPDANLTYTPKRIFVATIDGRLVSLDAKTGIPDTAFGKGGTIDLKEGFGSDLSVTSPPAIIGNRIIVGSSLGDNHRFDYPPGTVRAYDITSGSLIWSWNPIPSDSSDRAWQTWKGPKAHQAGAANAWSILSVDGKRDLVFIPTTSPSPDYYGGERLGDNLYGNSLVALHASTGKIAWHFQVVHHDLWDYDIAAQPMLIDLDRDGKKTPAVVVGTKMGHIFVLHRETGKPLFPVEERAVPQSELPGEVASPTQPFPVLPAPLGIQSISEKNAWGPNDAYKREAAARIASYQNKGIFTPPSYQGSIMTPGNVGGINWGGMCFDSKQHLLVTCINWFPAIIRMIPRDKLANEEKESPELLRSETGRQLGTPYVMKRTYLFKPDSGKLLMQSEPPWGTLVAIDMRDGSKKWEVPVGFMLDPKKYPGAENWGSISLGGPIVTAGNLVFVAATMDGYFRAFNAATGKLLWQYPLPAGGQATPMTYSVNGRQYVVISAGGHGKLGTKLGDYVVAFAIE